MGLGNLNPGCGCCEPVSICDVASDAFDRATSTNIGSQWIEDAGNWDIASGAGLPSGNNHLHVPGSSTRVIYDLDNPSTAPSFHVTVNVYGDNEQDELRLLVAYTDANNYLYARLKLARASFPTAPGILSLHQVASGVTTQLATANVAILPAAAWHTLTACYAWPTGDAHGVFIGTVTTSGGAFISVMAEADSTGLRVGLGTGTVSFQGRFNDFDWDRNGLVDPDCPVCMHCALCAEGVLAPEYSVTFGNITSRTEAESSDPINGQWDRLGCCPNLNGTYFVRDWTASSNQCDLIYNGPACVSEYPVCCDPGSGVSVFVRLTVPALDRVRIEVEYVSQFSTEVGGGGPWSIFFRVDVDAPLLCHGISNLNIPYATNTFPSAPGTEQRCHFSGATCVLSAL